MDPNEHINDNLVFLTHNIINLQIILLHLKQSKKISQNEMETINAEKTTLTKNWKMLDVIQRKCLPLDFFLEILRKSENEHCVDKIKGKSKSSCPQIPHPNIKQKWYPDNKRLIKSLHKRQIKNNSFVEELHTKILEDENRMVVIFESNEASKLTGMGGIGKTITAIWYAYEFEKEYEHIIWIDCGHLFNSLKKLAIDLGVKIRKEMNLEDFSIKIYQELIQWKCLWIFDNAESYLGNNGIQKILPVYKENFYCLITSRSSEWGDEDLGHGQISHFQIDVFNIDESLCFLKKNLKLQRELIEDELRELCELLGNLPLALQLAVRALNRKQIDLKRYIEKTPSCDIGYIVDKEFVDYKKVNAGINITLASILKEQQGQLATSLLNIFGYLRSNDVQADFLTKAAGVDVTAVRAQLNSAINLLKENYFLNQTANNELSIHSLLQQVVRHNERKSERDNLRKIFASCNTFLDYKIIPFIKYADEDLRTEFQEVKNKLLDKEKVVTLWRENRFEESIQLARFVNENVNEDMIDKQTEAQYQQILLSMHFCFKNNEN